LELARAEDKDEEEKYDWTMIELFDQTVRNHSGGEMLEYWKQDPMPQEEFVVERLGSEVKNALHSIRQNPKQYAKKTDIETDPLKIGNFRISGEIHQWMYDSFSLSRLLKSIGFTEVNRCHANESNIENSIHTY